ncbi:MAG: 2-oxoacid:acceptor oxidoreductase family protein [Promethearchaeota archaeon]
MTRTEIRLGGLGGQGIIKSAVIIGEAATIHDGKQAVQTASYGPESRGSACKAEVIISDQPVDYPLVLTPQIMVALSNDAFHKYKEDLREGGIVIIDSDLVKAGKIKAGVQVYHVPAAAAAHQVLKNPLVTNVVMLGAFTAITKAVTPGAMRKAIANAFPKYKELNLRAFDEGMQLGQEAMEQSTRKK